jgi:glycosyltransferase involved in cell wall biosynthesis
MEDPKGNIDAQVPVVSVVVTTYQHAPFIEKCVQGILMQRTDFPFEILIGEDESTDGTREICERLAAEHPDRIRLFLRSRKDVIYVMGKPTGRSNFVGLMRSATGKYIALCEGDDHWIDPLKLQRQVDAMEADPRATGCFTNAYNEQDGVRTAFLGVYARMPAGPVLDEAEYLSGQGIPTCTFIYRRDLAQEFFNVHLRFAGGDTPLFTVLLCQGHFIVQPEFTGVRVIHPGGIYSMQGALHHLKVRLRNSRAQDEVTKGRHSAILRRRLSSVLRGAWLEGIRTKNRPLASLAWRHLFWERSTMGWSLRALLANGLRVNAPRLYAFLDQLRWRVKGYLGLLDRPAR